MLYCQPFFEYTLIQLDSVQVDVGNENIRRFIGQLNHVIRVRSSEFFHCSVGGDFGGEWQECQFADAGTMYATSEMLNQVQVHTNNRWVGQTPWCKL